MIIKTSTTSASIGALALLLVPTAADGGDAVDASVFDYDADAPLVIVEGEALDLPIAHGHDIRPITYDSAGGKVTGYIAYPPEGPSEVGIIAMHGLPETSAQMIELPLSVMACFGATAIAIDAPYVRAGRRGPRSLTFTDTDRDEVIQLVVDLRRAVDVLESKGIERITYDGNSWSADIGTVLAGVEPRIDGFAMMVGGLHVDRFVRNDNHIDVLAVQPDDVADEWLDVMATVSAVHFVADATAPIVFRNNRNDMLVLPESAERLQAAAGDNLAIEWYDDSPDPAGHDMSLQMVVDHLHWQTDLLGLDRDRVDECLAPLIEFAPEGT